MELIGLALFALIGYGCLRFISQILSWLTGSRYRAFRRLSSHYGGRYETRGLADSPIVSFSQGEDLVRVGLAPASARRAGMVSTRVVVRFRRGIPFRLDLFPHHSMIGRMSEKGTQPVRLGDREFDNAYAVRANDPEMARDFLTPSVRWSIQNLQRLVHPGGLSMAVSPERMLVQIDRNLSEDQDALFSAVADALSIHEGLRHGVRGRISEGVAVLEGDGVAGPEEGPPICKVCGEAVVDGPIIVCSKCGAPHHGDCWEFVGWCSIYGCGGKIGRPPGSPSSLRTMDSGA